MSLLPKWGFPTQNLVFLEENFSDKKKISWHDIFYGRGSSLFLSAASCHNTDVCIWLAQIFTHESRMLCASLPSSVRPSVCLSVTLVICIKTVQARITKSSLWAAPRSLVYRDKISCHWVQGFPSNEGVKEGYPPKKTSFCRYWLE